MKTKLVKRIGRGGLVFSAALALPGCLQNETTVRLNKDGSGTLVEETTFGAQMTAMLAQLAAMGGEGDPLGDLVSEEKAKARAASLGEGVTFEKIEEIRVDGKQGGRVTYRFEDINHLRISPEGTVKNAMPEMPMAPDATPEARPVTFTYGGGKLTISMPEPEAVDAPAAEDAGLPEPREPGAQELAMMKQMMGDMKVAFRVVVEPGIGETNATYASGDTITLMEMDFGQLMENEESFRKLSRLDRGNPDAALKALKTIEGVKVENRREVTVEVK